MTAVTYASIWHSRPSIAKLTTAFRALQTTRLLYILCGHLYMPWLKNSRADEGGGEAREIAILCATTVACSDKNEKSDLHTLGTALSIFGQIRRLKWLAYSKLLRPEERSQTCARKGQRGAKQLALFAAVCVVKTLVPLPFKYTLTAENQMYRKRMCAAKLIEKLHTCGTASVLGANTHRLKTGQRNTGTTAREERFF